MKKLSLRHALLTTAVTFAALTVGAQNVQKFTANKAGDYGLSYTLPNTVLDITIETETTVSTPGEFYQYARRYFNITDPITERSTAVSVKSITINTHGEPNPEDRYLVTFKSGYTPFMLLNPDGTPRAINSEKLYTPDVMALPEPHEAELTPLQKPAARQALNEEIMQSRSTAKRAELAAAQIFALRQSRNDLITGQAEQMPPDGKAMELILNNINDQEAALMAMFVGTRATSTQVTTVSYLPKGDSDVITRRVIARVSPVTGVVDAADLSGIPVYLTLRAGERPTLPLNTKGQPIEVTRDALVYRLPCDVDVVVEFDGRELASDTFQMAQYGILYGFKPGTFTDRKAPAYAVFDPTTGGIVEVGTAPVPAKQ